MARMTQYLCIFCNTPLTRHTKPEHVLLDALGGRRTSRHLICTPHNEEFGRTIDKALAGEVATVRNIMQMRSDSGRPPPAYIQESRAGRILYQSNGRPRIIDKPFHITPEAEGATIAIQGNSEEEIANSVRNIAAKLKLPLHVLWDKLKEGSAAPEEQFMPLPTERRQLSFGSLEARRSMAKACMSLVALALGNDVVRGEAFRLARANVLGQEADSSDICGVIDSRWLPGRRRLEEAYGKHFNAVYVAADDNGRMFGHFTLYNIVAWRFALAAHSAPPGFRAALVSNPLLTKDWSDKVADKFGIDAAWLLSPQPDPGRNKERLVQLFEAQAWIAREAEFARITEEEFCRGGIVDNVVSDADGVKKSVFDGISQRVARMLLRVPHSRPIDMARIEALLFPLNRSEG